MAKKVYSYSGTEHYRLAEAASDEAEKYEGDALILTLGQGIIHALLANAAATALAGPNVTAEWRETLNQD